jgi:hypothetical protein
MTKRPPSWYGKAYGNYTQGEWDEAVRRTREILAGWARREHVGSYSSFIDELRLLDWPDGAHTHHGSQVGKLLGDASVEEWLEDRPLLTALVIVQDKGDPGEGFYGLVEELTGTAARADTDSRLRAWSAEVERCFSFWKSR